MKEALKVYIPLALIALVLVTITMRFVSPPPPKSITFAAGGVDGQYYALAQQYRTRLTEIGIQVDVLETAGTIENYSLLIDGTADVAFLQGGLSDTAAGETLESLGGMFAEPFWIFVRAGTEATTFEDLRSMKVAAGGEGSGTRALTRNLQAEWGGTWSEPSSLSGTAEANALLAGDVDAALFAASVDALYVQKLLKDDRARQLPVKRANALSMHDASLAPVTLYEGVVSLDPNQPAQDLPLVAAIAQLGVRSDLHPAIQSVLLEAAEPIHAGGSILSRAGSFPDATRTDLPLSVEARRYYRKGPSFLRRYFSFGMANFLERAWIFLIPMLTLMIPLSRLAPPLYRWRIRRRIYVWYNDLHELEHRGVDAADAQTREAVLDEIQALQHEVGRVEVPVSYNDELYHLRSHINFVEALIARRRAKEPQDI